MRRARYRMANHDAVNAHGLDVLGGVDEALAFREAGAARGEVDGVGAQALGRQAEAGPRPRRRFEKKINNHLALEIRQFLSAALADLDELFRSIENRLQLATVQVFQSEQVTAGPSAGFRLRRGKLHTHGNLPRVLTVFGFRRWASGT